jgi:two-component system chemotaxis sensor kinase CheA
MSDPLRIQLLAVYADEHRDHLAALRAAFAGGQGVDLEEAYRHAHSLKGAARAVDLPAVVDLAHGLESLLEAWWESGHTPDGDMVLRARRALDAIEDLSAAALAGDMVPATHAALADLAEGLRAHDLAAQEMPAPRQSSSPCAPSLAAPTLRIDAAAADRLSSSMAQLLTELERLRAGRGSLRRLGGVLAQLAAHGGDAAKVHAQFADAMRLVEERGWAVSRTAETLAEDVARLRLVAAEAALGGLGPMVREVAASLGKQVLYDAEGLATMADRDVLMACGEAVSHLLRNAVVHGIETPEQRRAAGKDEAGRVTLSVQSANSRLEVRVADDGRGLDTGQLLDRAVARGVLTPAQARRADPERLRQLVFLPGLSTADDVTTVAGRGMGMAIVRRVIDRMQGSVSLESAPGGGTEVMLSLPISIIAQRIVLVCVRGRTLGLAASALVRVATVAADAVSHVEGEAVAAIGDGDVPLADLGVLLGLPPPEARPELCVVVVRGAGERLGLVVDEVLDVRDMPVAPLDGLLADDARLAGTVTLEGGELALVLSPAGLRVHRAAAAAPPQALNAEAAAVPPSVLVVDDSITTRTLERSILEAHAYGVQVAVDGRDALDRMAEWVPDVVVSDIDMPRMDGFGLLATMRADPRLAKVPVVLVSSRGSAADRERGLALGADAYIVKTRFDQDELLRIIGRLAG